jgi:hypothetical protein
MPVKGVVPQILDRDLQQALFPGALEDTLAKYRSDHIGE